LKFGQKQISITFRAIETVRENKQRKGGPGLQNRISVHAADLDSKPVNQILAKTLALLQLALKRATVA